MAEDLSEIKRILRSAYWMQKRLDADLEYLARLRAKAEAVGVRYDRPRVSCGEHKGPEEAACAIVDYEKKIEAQIECWKVTLQRVTEIIYNVPSQNLEVLLQMRYLNFWTFEKIAAELGYTWRHVNRLHVAALKEAKRAYGVVKEKLTAVSLQ